MPRKTDSNNPADWVSIATSDLEGIAELSGQEISYEMCRSKLAEVIEKLMKAELLRLGWFLDKTHDLQRLFTLLEVRASGLCPQLRPLVSSYADVYFMARYPGFDLEEPDWPALRQDIAATGRLLVVIDKQLSP